MNLDFASPQYTTTPMPAWFNGWHQVLRVYVFSIAFWMPVSVLVGWQEFVMDNAKHVQVSLSTELLIYSVRYLTIAFLTPPIFYCVIHWPLSGLKLRRIGLYFCGYIAFSCAFALIRWALLPPWVDATNSWGPRSLERLLQLGYDTFADILLVYVGILIAAHAYSYLTRIQQQELARLRLHQLLAQSELQSLRAQFQPHFLFNALQGISTLIETNPLTAQRMLHTLASLLRAVLQHRTSDLVSFREEIVILRAYLDLEQMRLGSRLSISWRVAPEAEASLIPQLILQPLVENAIVHGVAPAREGGWISIEAHLREDRLLVEIRNSVAATSQRGMQLGLANVRARLAHLFADDAEFEFALLSEGKVAIASLEVPAFVKSTENFALASSS